MFILRSLFWLSTVVLLLPASPDGKEPPPRVSLINTAYAARAFMQDLSGMCDRNPAACAVSREAMLLVFMKLHTGAEIVTAGISAGKSGSTSEIDHGTLTAADIEPAWSFVQASR
jgi:Family of unknown function (DUF5330)